MSRSVFDARDWEADDALIRFEIEAAFGSPAATPLTAAADLWRAGYYIPNSIKDTHE